MNRNKEMEIDFSSLVLNEDEQSQMLAQILQNKGMIAVPRAQLNMKKTAVEMADNFHLQLRREDLDFQNEVTTLLIDKLIDSRKVDAAGFEEDADSLRESANAKTEDANDRKKANAILEETLRKFAAK